MNTINETKTFRDWLKKLKDPKGTARIARRIDRAASGNFGDIKTGQAHGR